MMKKVILILIMACFIIFGGYGIYHKYNADIVIFRGVPVNKSDNKKDILLVHPHLINSGALVMLYNLAKILIDNNYSVYFLKFSNTKNSTYFDDLGIPIIKVDRQFFRDVKTDELKMFYLFIWNTRTMMQRWWENRHRFKSILWLHSLNIDLQGNLYYTNSTLDECFENDEKVNLKHKVVTVSPLAYCNAEGGKKIATKDNIIYNMINEDVVVNSGRKYFGKIFRKKKDKIVFSTIGRLEGTKRQHVLLDAIDMLPEEYKQKSSFNIVGAIENKEYAKRVTDRITGNVKFIESVPYKQMGDIYAQTDVLLHPSWIDAAPLVIAEAAANNIPSVITDHVGSTYIVRDKESGFVIPVDNAEILKEKIMWFIDNPEQIEIMGEKANQYYRETSQKEVFKIRWLQLIEKVLSE